jgi:hypothetical protein
MKNKIRSSFFFLSLLFSFTGCYYDVESELYPAAANNTCDTTAVTYATTIGPLITSSCATSGCHAAGAQSPDLSNYAGLNGSIDRVAVRAITEKTMPPSGPMNSCSILALQAWINRGALNN